MKFFDNLKLLGLIISTLGGVLLFIAGFAPNEIENKNIEFVSIVLLHSLPEILFLFVIGILLWQYSNIKRLIFRITQYPYYSRNLKRKVNLVIGITLVCFILLNLTNFYYVMRARYWHYTNIYKSHKFQYYTKISSKINEGELIEALAISNGLLKDYPDEKFKIESLNKSLELRIQNAQNHYPNEDVFMQQNSEVINHEKFIKLTKAYALHPNQYYEKELTKTKNILIDALEETISLANNKNISLSEKDKKIEELSWFLFDKSLTPDIRKENISEIEYLNNIFKNNSTQEIETLYRNFWMLDYLTKLLKWKRNVVVEMDEEYYNSMYYIEFE